MMPKKRLYDDNDLPLVTELRKGTLELKTFRVPVQKITLTAVRRLERLGKKVCFLVVAVIEVFSKRCSKYGTSIRSQFCKCWVHEICTSIRAKLKLDDEFICRLCVGQEIDVT